MATEKGDIVAEIIAAKDLKWNWEPEHPQYIEGRLYLTQAQCDAVAEAFPADPRAGQVRRGSYAWGIPVTIIEPNKAITLPSGKVLIYSSLLDSFYVFDSAIAREAGITPWEVLDGHRNSP